MLEIWLTLKIVWEIIGFAMLGGIIISFIISAVGGRKRQKEFERNFKEVREKIKQDEEKINR